MINDNYSDAVYSDYKKGWKAMPADKPQVPDSGLFNPYDYIDQSWYRMNRRGQAAYAEDLAALQYLAEQRQQEFQNEYASPEQEAMRMRAAGLNPDLLGVSGQSSASGPSVSSNPMQGIPTNLDQAGQAVNIVTSVASLVTSMMSGGLNLQAMTLGNLDKEVQLLDGFVGAISKGKSLGFDMTSLLSNRSKKFLRNFSGDHTGASMLSSLRFTNQLQTEMFKDEDNVVTNRMRLYDPRFKLVHRDKYTTDVVTEEEWAEVFEPLANFAYDAFRYNLAGDAHSAKNRADYESTEYVNADGSTTSLGAQRGNAEMASLSESEANAETNSALRAPLREVAKNLKKKSDEGNTWATFALIALYFVSNMTLSSSSGPKGKSFSGGMSLGF